MKKIKFQERPDFWIPFLLYAGLLLFKLVFIIDNRSMPVISDEFRYVRFARSLLEKGSYHSTQYPLAYPLALIPAFLMGSHFYTAIKVLNAVYSSFVPVLMYAIARLYLKPKESAVCGFFSAILPFHYVTVMSIMSENLYFPLFLLAIYVLLKDHPRHKIGADVLLGFLIGACYLTRHVTLVTIPVFALVWFVKQLDEKEKIPVIFLRGFLIVGVMGLTYSPWLIMCVREGLTIKNALGFSIASKTNPEQLTMPRLAQSCMLYVSYIVLGSAPCIGFALKALRGFEWKRLFGPYNRLLLTCYGFAGALLVAVSRHSWRAYYNYPEFVKLKGRYLMYLPALLILLAMVAAFAKKITFKRKWTQFVVMFVIPAGLFAYALHVNVGQYLRAEVEYYEAVDGQKVLLIGQAVLIGYTVVMWIGQMAAEFGKQTSKMVKRLPALLTAVALVFEGYAGYTYLGKLDEMNQHNEEIRCNEVYDMMAALERADLPREDKVMKVYTGPIPEFTFMRRNVEMFVNDQVKFYKFQDTEDKKKPDEFYIVTRTPEDFDEGYSVNENITSFLWENKTYYFNHVKK